MLVSGVMPVHADDAIIVAEEHVAEHVETKKSIEAAAAKKAVMQAEKDKFRMKLAATPSVKTKTARASLLNNAGKTVGEASFWQGSHGVVIKLYVEGLAAGSHGLHIHQKGKCDVETGFKSAAGHIKHDTETSHGFLHHQGPHAGDLPNLIVHADGTAHVELYSERIRLYYSQKHEHMMPLLLSLIHI